MAVELAYVLVTPPSLVQSRTGGILARLLTRSGCELVAVRLFAPGPELIRDYAAQIVAAGDPPDRPAQERLRDQVLTRLGPESQTGRRRRVLLLVFKGETAVQRIGVAVGDLTPPSPNFEPSCDTSARRDPDFGPVVLVAPNAAAAISALRLWARHSTTDGGVIEGVVTHPPGVSPQRTLVLVKPDSFRAGGGRPGNIVDFFDSTGLSLIGARLLRFSTAQALEFYGPVRAVLRTRLGGFAGAEARRTLGTNPELGFAIPPDVEARLGELLGPLYGDFRFDNLIRFMSGRSAAECPPAELDQPGTEPCLALVYEGPDAVRKCREVLGPTDPAQAPRGTIRREFGTSILVNAAHASDSEENARREIAIVQPEADDLAREIEAVHGVTPATLPDSRH